MLNTTSAAQTVTLTNSGTAALNITSIVASAPYAQTNTCGASLAAGANCSINVTFTPTAVGSLPGTITVTDNATGSPQTVNLTGTGAASSVSFAPTSLAFGNQNLNTTSAAQIASRCTNSGTAALNITSIVGQRAVRPDQHLRRFRRRRRQLLHQTSRSRPPAAGSQPGTITVTDNATGSPQTVNLDRHGRGIQRQLRANQLGLRQSECEHHQRGADGDADQFGDCSADHHQHRGQRAVRPDQHLRRFPRRRRQLLHQRHLHAYSHRQPARYDYRHG